MALTPEERQRIYEAERVRHEARRQIQSRDGSGTEVLAGGCLLLIFGGLGALIAGPLGLIVGVAFTLIAAIFSRKAGPLGGGRG